MQRRTWGAFVWVLTACWLCCAVAKGAPARRVADPASAPAEGNFGPAQFAEVVDILSRQHLEPGLKRPRAWAAAANGALTAARTGREVLDGAWRAKIVSQRKRFGGATAPLQCDGKPVPGIVLHDVPPGATWRAQDKALAGSAPGVTGEPLVDALGGWQAPFDRAHFRCVADMATAALRGSPAEKAAAQDKVWRNAATYLLRAIDPHSRLTTPKAWAKVNEAITTVVDLGLTFRWRAGDTVVSAIAETASEQARLVHVGDILRAVDGQTIKGKRQAAVVGLLRRPVGTRVRLTFSRTDQAEPLEVTLQYQNKRERDVEAAELADLPGTLWVRVRKFAAASGKQVRALLEDPPVSGPLRGVLLDLRGNRGGIIPEAVLLVEVLRRGGLIGRVRTRDATAAVQLSRRRRRIITVPVVLLVDRGCASACEFVTASLRDRQRALVVGAPTFGKATMQEYMSMKTSSARLMITIAMFASPDDLPIQAQGVAPDLNFETPKKRGRALGEAAMPFHLMPLPGKRKRAPLPAMAEIRACWQNQGGAAGRGADPWLGQATVALKCLLQHRQGR